MTPTPGKYLPEPRQHTSACPECDGIGSLSCFDCRGTGVLPMSQAPCHGCGERGEFVCEMCKGVGRVEGEAA